MVNKINILMSKFLFQNLALDVTRIHVHNVTYFKHLVEKEFGLEKIIKILYFIFCITSVYVL